MRKEVLVGLFVNIEVGSPQFHNWDDPRKEQRWLYYAEEMIKEQD